MMLARPAGADWPAPPTRLQLMAHLMSADSVSLVSAWLPDSAQAQGRWGSAIVPALQQSKRRMLPMPFARALFHRMFATDSLDHDCGCELVRYRDTTAVAVPMLECWVAGSASYVPVVFRDSCAEVFLPQGPWGGTPVQSSYGDVLQMLQAVPGADTSWYAAVADQRMNVPVRDPRLGMHLLDVQPELIERVPPEYPEAARAANISGTVAVMARVSRSGSVQQTFIAWSIPGLDEAAVRAVSQWRFRPARENGRPAAVWVSVPVTFTLH
jgi:TonB family protein